MLFADAEKKVLPPNIQLYIARGIEPCNSTASGEARAVSLNFNKTRKKLRHFMVRRSKAIHTGRGRRESRIISLVFPISVQDPEQLAPAWGRDCRRRDAEHLGSAGQWARTIRLFLFLTALG